MILSDFVGFQETELKFPTITCQKNPNHKTFDYDDKKKHPTQYVDNTEALFLIKKARDSFLSHKKIKDKNIKQNYLNIGVYSKWRIDTHFYLSNDGKFYCLYLNITYGDGFAYYLFGIIEKLSGKHLFIVNKFHSNIIECCYVKHHMFNYYPSDKYMYLSYVSKPPIMISFDTKEKLDNCHKPLDIIDSLEDYFSTLYGELSEL